MLTALTIHLFKVDKFLVAFLHVSHRAFWPKRFLCYLAFFSAIQKVFRVVLPYLYFSFWRDASPPVALCHFAYPINNSVQRRRTSRAWRHDNRQQG